MESLLKKCRKTCQITHDLLSCYHHNMIEYAMEFLRNKMFFSFEGLGVFTNNILLRKILCFSTTTLMNKKINCPSLPIFPND